MPSWKLYHILWSSCLNLSAFKSIILPLFCFWLFSNHQSPSQFFFLLPISLSCLYFLSVHYPICDPFLQPFYFVLVNTFNAIACLTFSLICLTNFTPEFISLSDFLSLGCRVPQQPHLGPAHSSFLLLIVVVSNLHCS